MSLKTGRFGPSLVLLTDLYQLTMAHGYWKVGMKDKEAVFHLFCRKNPFQSGFSIACGLKSALDFLDNFHFEAKDAAYLAQLTGNDGKALFEPAFLDYLQSLTLSCDLDAVPEGTVIFPFEPLLRVQGPLIQCQILESALLNVINFQTLIATKAARICLAAQGEPVFEFGLRRAQGIDGALSACRAAYIGGCAGTSNVLAAKLFGIPVKGTHAHGWVMAFDDELEAFQAYAAAMPNNSLFLVDTYDTLEGVRKAVEVGKWLRRQGHEMIGIRLDSGDLAYLSIEARKILDAEGFPEAVIIATNELDEHIISSLKAQGAAINVWAVGTKLVSGHGECALAGVYKLSAVRENGKAWQYKIKLSEQAVKISNPGIQQVRRYWTDQEFLADVIFDLNQGISDGCVMVDHTDMTRRKQIPERTPFIDLLVPVFRSGKAVYKAPPIEQMRQHAQDQLTRFHAGIKRLTHPHHYPVGLEQRLHELKIRLILQARGTPT
jgi:nicotinate phosphoribosyltransferase